MLKMKIFLQRDLEFSKLHKVRFIIPRLGTLKTSAFTGIKSQ